MDTIGQSSQSNCSVSYLLSIDRKLHSIESTHYCLGLSTKVSQIRLEIKVNLTHRKFAFCLCGDHFKI